MVKLLRNAPAREARRPHQIVADALRGVAQPGRFRRAGRTGWPEETRAVLSPDGWLATGDIGHVDGDGYLCITDRKKDLIKIAGGKYVAPQAIEDQLKLQRFVEQVHVPGDRRPYCVAVIVPKPAALRAWAREQGLPVADDAELVAHPQAVAAVQADVDAVNATLARYQAIKRFVLTAEPFTEANGQLTPTMKVRRKIVDARYAREIDELYERARELPREHLPVEHPHNGAPAP